MLYIKSIKKNSLWYLINAKDKILGRLCTKIVYLLMGKNNYSFKSNIINGSYVVVINISKIKLTGNKFSNKLYYHHSGYIGGLKCKSFKNIFEKFPERIIRHCVKGMLPKNFLGRLMLKRLKIYTKNIHKHNSKKLILIN